MFLVPKTDYTIIDNWFVMGMSGTGSKGLPAQRAKSSCPHTAL